VRRRDHRGTVAASRDTHSQAANAPRGNRLGERRAEATAGPVATALFPPSRAKIHPGTDWEHWNRYASARAVSSPVCAMLLF
jgi:hypothetical protein